MNLYRMVSAGLFLLSSLAFAGVDSQLLGLIPTNAKVVSGIQIEQGKNSRFGQYMLSRMQSDNNGLQKLITETGFDPRRDLREAVFASDGVPQNPQFTILVRGSFDPQKIVEAAKAKGSVVEKYAGVDLILAKDQKDRGFAFLDSSLAVLADRATLRSIVSRRNEVSPLDNDLLNKIQELSNTNDAWFVSLVPTSSMPFAMHPGNTKNSSMHAEAIQSIQQSSGGVHFGDQVALQMEALTRSGKDATALGDVIRFMASMVQMQRSSKGPRAEIVSSWLDQMSLKTEGNTVKVALSIPEQQLEQLIAERPRHQIKGKELPNQR